MKKYKITHFPKTPGYIDIINQDKNPIITKIECSTYNSKKDGTGYKLWTVNITINDETDEIRQLFHSVPEALQTLMEGHEGIINQKDMKNVIKFFGIIQKVDPLPHSALLEVMESIDFDLKELLNTELIMKKAHDGQHSEALKLTMEANEKGDIQALPALANFYQEQNDVSNYINVLSNIPFDHHSFKAANEELLDYLQSLPIASDKQDRINLLERKFTAALCTENIPLATRFFDELSGGNGLAIKIDNVKGDPKTLIKIAAQFREMNAKINELENYKAQNEARKETEKKSKKHKPNELNFNDNNNSVNSFLFKPFSNG